MNRTRAILVSALAGTVFTVASGWVSVFRSDAGSRRQGHALSMVINTGALAYMPPQWQSPSSEFWPVPSYETVRVRESYSTTTTVICVNWLPNAESGRSEPRLIGALTYWESGWPLRSLECTRITDIRAGTVAMSGGLDLSALLHSNNIKSSTVFPDDSCALACTPLPVPFIIDSVIYSMLTFSSYQLARIYKCRRRRSYALCSKCSYPLVGLKNGAPCPECGADISNVKK